MRTRTPPFTRELGWAAAIAMLLSGLAWLPMLLSYPHAQVHDGAFFHKMVEVARVSIVRYHEMPLWNPFECGGVPLWDNPQGVAAAPMTWLTVFFDTTRVVQLWFFVHSTLGVLSMWTFARLDLKLSPAASLIAGASFAFAGVLNLHFYGGHLVFTPYLYFPFALFLWRRAEHDLRAAVGLGLVVALTELEGGVYPTPYLAILLGTETLFRLVPLRRFVPIVKAAGVVVVVAFSVGAMRYLPVFDQLLHHHRDIGPDTDAMQWDNLRDVFLVREHGRGAPGQQYIWPEYGDYLGPTLLILAGLGVLTLQLSELWILALAIFSFSLMCGHFAPWAPWSVLNKYVYPFKQMRVPSRFAILVTLFFSVFIGMAIDRWPRRFPLGRTYRQKGLAGLLLALGLVGVGDQIAIDGSWSWPTGSFTGAPEDHRAKPAERLHVGGAPGGFLDTPHANVIDLGCWEEWAFNRDAPLWSGDVPQAKGDNHVKVQHVDRTINTFTVQIEAAQPGRILFNSTYDRGWRTDVGEAVQTGKMLAVDVPAGTATVHVKYWPHGLTLGLFLSSLSTLTIAFFAIRGFRRWWAKEHERLSPIAPV